MAANESQSSERSRRLDEVITTYLKASEAGQAPNQADWLARYPDLADDLAAFFAAQLQVERAAAPLRGHPASVFPFDPFAVQHRPAAGRDAPTIAPGESRPDQNPPDINPPLPGAKVGYFGDYELLAEIGRGGM